MAPTKTLITSGRLTAAAKLIVDVIDVGQGNAILVSFPNGNFMLVDCGSQQTSQSGTAFKHAQQYITQVTGGKNITTVVITHGDTDHTAFIPYIKEAQMPTNIIVGGMRRELGENVQNWLKTQDNRGWNKKRKRDIPPCYVFFFKKEGYSSATPDADFGGADSDVDTNVYILGANLGTTANDRSIVLLLSYGNQKVVLTGDAEGDTENYIIANIPDSLLSPCTLFVPAHHGSFYSTSQDWVKALSPDLSAITASGTNKAFAHPDCTTVEIILEEVTNGAAEHTITCSAGRNKPYELSETTKALAVTATNGDIRYTTDGIKYKVQVSSL